MNWKVGDRAICTKPGSDMEGLQVEIISELKQCWCSNSGGYFYMGYGVDPGFPPNKPHARWGARPQYLKPIPDSYDGLQITTWDECPWQPKELVKV